MSQSNSIENRNNQPLPLQELLAKILNVPTENSTRRSLPITGTMQWLNEQLRPFSILDSLNITLRGIG